MLQVKVHATNTNDTIAEGSVFEEVLFKYPTLRGVCGDDSWERLWIS